MNQTLETLIYTLKNGAITLAVKVDQSKQALWLNQKQMSELFETSTDNISQHIKNIYFDSKLVEASTTQDFSVVQKEGTRNVRRKLKFYNLDIINEMGRRVRSQEFVRFSRWTELILNPENTAIITDSELKKDSFRQRIFTIRDKRVMLDSDLSDFYSVSTKALNQAVKRNHKRFPDSFCFQLTAEEYDILRSQIVTSSWGGRRILPYVFTEFGILQAASVLNSDIAHEMSIKIIETFVEMKNRFNFSDLDAIVKKHDTRLSRLETAQPEIFAALKYLIEKSDNGLYFH